MRSFVKEPEIAFRLPQPVAADPFLVTQRMITIINNRWGSQQASGFLERLRTSRLDLVEVEQVMQDVFDYLTQRREPYALHFNAGEPEGELVPYGWWPDPPEVREEFDRQKQRNLLTVDADVAAAMESLAIGEMRHYTRHPNGEISFEIDQDVQAALEQKRFPGESDSDLVRRLIKERTGVEIPQPKPN